MSAEPQGRLGSHNALTFLAPRRWWMRLLSPSARCQSRAPGPEVGLYDLRVRPSGPSGSVPMACHGLSEYLPLSQALRLMGEWAAARPCGRAVVRVLTSGAPTEEFLKAVAADLSAAEGLGLEFACGRNAKGWAKDLPWLPDLDEEQPVASMSSWWGGAWPWLWNKVNAKALSERRARAAAAESGPWVLMDFN